jgi:hypothetical protein
MSSLEARLARQERARTARRGSNSYPGAYYLPPEILSWADFLLRGGPLAAVPQEFQEDASNVSEAAKILQELLDSKGAG